MKRVYLSLGTNLGNKEKNINDAYARIKKDVGPITQYSDLLKTAPWGYDSTEEFVNSVIEVRTLKSVIELSTIIQQIERDLGRVPNRTDGYADRVIDIDIIDYDGSIWMDDQFTIPHAKMHLRLFVLDPLFTLNSDWIHPVFKKSIKDLKTSCMNRPPITE